ncbi:Zinc finger C2H2-type [Trinorchestia longiramus]|nr:Zinc finger C2H2-type [Trinorchestia longiramus]
MEKVLVSKDKNGACDNNPHEASWSEDATGACLCFMCRRPVMGKVQPTVDMLSTVVSKVTVREKVEHETGCQLSAIQRLPTGVCSDCYNIVNEIDVLEHKLNLYRSFLRSNVQASITNFKKDDPNKQGRDSKLDVNPQRNSSPVASTSEDSSVDNLIAVDDGNYDAMAVSLNDVFSKNSLETHPHSKISSSISLVSREMPSSVSFPSLPLQLSPIPLTSKADTSVSKLILPSACSIQFPVASGPQSSVCQPNNNTPPQSSYTNNLDNQEKPCNLSVDASNNSSNLLPSSKLNEIPVCMIQQKSFNDSEHQGCHDDSVSTISFCQLESLEHCPPSQVMKESPKKFRKSNLKGCNISKPTVSSIEAEMYQFPSASIDFATQTLSNITPSILSSSSSERFSSNSSTNIATTGHATSSDSVSSVSTPQKLYEVPCSGDTPKKGIFQASIFHPRSSRADAGVSCASSNSAIEVSGLSNSFTVSNATSCNTPIDADAHRASFSSSSSVVNCSHSSAVPVSLKVHSPLYSSKTSTSSLDATSCVDHEDQTISSADIMDISHSLSHIRSCCESSARICPSNFVFNSPNDDSLDSSMNNSFLSANCPISISLLSPSFPSAPTYSSLLSPESQVVSCTSPSFLLSLHSSSLDANLFSYANDRTTVSKTKENQVVEMVHKTSQANGADKSDGDLIQCNTSNSVNDLYDLPLMFPKTKESSPKQGRDPRKTKLEKSPEKHLNPNQDCSLSQRMSCGVTNKFSILCTEMEENTNKHTDKVDAQTMPSDKLSEGCLDGKRTKRCVNESQVSDILSEAYSLSFSSSERPSNYVKSIKKHTLGLKDTSYMTNGKVSDESNGNSFPPNEFRHDSFAVGATTSEKLKMSELPSELITGSSKPVVSCQGVTLQSDPLLHVKSATNSLSLFDADHGLKTTEGFSAPTEIANSLSLESEVLIDALKNGAPSLVLNSERCEGVVSSFIHGSSSVTCRTNQSNLTSHANHHSSTSPVKTLQCSSHPTVKVSASFLDNYQDSLKSDHIHSQLSSNFDGALPITSIFNSKPSFRSNELLRAPDEGSNIKFSDALIAKISFPLCSPTYSHFTTGIVASTVTSSSADCLPSIQSDSITSHRQFLSPTTKSHGFCSHGNNSSSRHSSVCNSQDSAFASNLPCTSSKIYRSESPVKTSPMKTRSSKKLEMGVISYAPDFSSKSIDKRCPTAARASSKSKEKHKSSIGLACKNTKGSSGSSGIKCSALIENQLNSLDQTLNSDREVDFKSTSCSDGGVVSKRVAAARKRVRYSTANRRKNRNKRKLSQSEKEKESYAETSQNADCVPCSVPSTDNLLSSCESTMKNLQLYLPSENSSEYKASKMMKSSHLDAASLSTCKKSLFRDCSNSNGKELSKPLESCEGMELIFSDAPFDYTNSNETLVADENCNARLSFDSKKNIVDKLLPKNDLNGISNRLKTETEVVHSSTGGNNHWESVPISSDKTCSAGKVSVNKGSQTLISNFKCQPDKNRTAQESKNSSVVDSNLAQCVTANANKDVSLSHVSNDMTKSNTEESKHSSNNVEGNFDNTRSSIITSSHRNVSSILVQSETLNMSTEFFEHIVASSSDASHFSIDSNCIPVDGQGLISDGCDRSSFTVTTELINHTMESHPTSNIKNCSLPTFSNTLSIPVSNTATHRQGSNFSQGVEIPSGIPNNANLALASQSNVSMTCKQSVGNVLNNVDSFSALHFPSSRAIQGQSSQETRISNIAVSADNKMNSINMQRYFYSDNSSGQDTSALRLHSEMDNNGSSCTKSVLTQCNFPQNNGPVCHSNQVLAGGGRQMMPVNKVRSANIMSEGICSNHQNQAMFGQIIEQNNFDSRRSNNAINRSNASVLSAVQMHSSAGERSDATIDKKLPSFASDVPQNGSAVLHYENFKHERPYCQKNDVQLQASLGNHLIHGNGINGDIHGVQQHQFQNNCTYPIYQEMLHPCNQVPINNSNFVNYTNSNSAVQNYGRSQVNDMRNFSNAYNPHVHIAQHSSGITVATPQQMMGCTPNAYFQPTNIGSRSVPLKINSNQMGCVPQTALNTQHTPINNSVHELPLMEEEQTMLLSSFTSQSNLSHLSASVYAVSNQNVSTNAENAIQCKNNNRSGQGEGVRDHTVKSGPNAPLSVSTSLEHSVQMPTNHCMSTYDSNSINRQSAHPSKMRGNVLQNDPSNCQVLCNPEITNHAIPPLPYALNAPNVGMHSHPVQVHANNVYGDNAQQNHIMPEQQLHYIQQHHNLGYCANSFCEVPSVHTGMPYQYPEYHRNKHNLHNHTMSEYVGPVCDVSGQQHIFQDALHNTYAASLVPQAASNNFNSTEIYPTVKKCDSVTDLDGRNVSACTGAVKLGARKQKCLVSEDVASSSSEPNSKVESCKKTQDKTDNSGSASCVINCVTDGDRSTASKLVRGRDNIQLENSQIMAVTCVPEQVKNSVPQSDCILSVDTKALFNGVESNKSINHTTYEFSQVLLGSEKIEDLSSLRRDMYSELNSPREQSSPVDVDNASLDKAECSKTSEETQNCQVNTSLESSLISYNNPYSVVSSVKTATEMDIDIEECDCSDDHLLLDPGPSDHSDISKTTVFEGGSTGSEVSYSEEHDLLNLKVSKNEVIQDNQECSQSGTHNSEDSNPLDDPPCKLLDRPSTPELLRNVQEATEYHKPTLLTRNFKMKKHAKLQICRQCDQVFSTRHCLVRHIERRHKINVTHFNCPHCEKKCNTEKSLARHVLQHKTFSCKLCEEVFSSRKTFKKHIEQHSRENLTCQQCSKNCSTFQALIAHMASHRRKKAAISCDVCNKEFANKRNLAVHQLTHTGERPHSCSNCHKSFSVRSNMMAHEERCLDKCRFKCEICSRGFPLESVYKRHLAEHEEHVEGNHRQPHGEENGRMETEYDCIDGRRQIQ